jgi:hypothetical protein
MPDASAMMGKVFPPETDDVVWMRGAGQRSMMDFWEETGVEKCGVAYVSFAVRSKTAQDACLAVSVDYYVKVWANSELVSEVSELHGSKDDPVLMPVNLNAGENRFLLKVGSGSIGHQVSVSLATDTAEVILSPAE